ncbi:MAG: glycerol-3-phosphate 1-O-acyltransferase PlsY [Candidatus Cloacimonadaceae bacterium]|nr:glycerol-3-phosphate 1-O-acyltransferase PlsY [Candidatus Cloacimonadaceae bacterium]
MMNEVSSELIIRIAMVILAYLIGSIPFGYLIGKIFYKKDIRQSGSGNIGATNALRSFGVSVGIFVLSLDLLKGFLAILLARYLLADFNVYIVLSGLFVILGHVFPIFLQFKGGKGVATSAGVFLALSTVPLLITLLSFIIIVWITRFVSVGSILSAICFHILVLSQEVINNTNNIALVVFTTVVVLLLIYKHQDNLARLLNGTENKLEFKKKNK